MAAAPELEAAAPYAPSFYTTKISSITLQVTALIEACALGQPRAVEEELARIEAAGGAQALAIELQATDDWAGSSALHWASYSDSADSINLLLEAGANIVLTNVLDGSTALHLAGRYGSMQAASALIAAGAAVGDPNSLGNTPLHECCSPARAVLRGAGAQLRVAKELLQARAPVDVHNSAPFTTDDGDTFVRGVTPLLIAAEVGSIEMIRLLLRWGADPFASTRKREMVSAMSQNEANDTKGVQFKPQKTAPALCCSFSDVEEGELRESACNEAGSHVDPTTPSATKVRLKSAPIARFRAIAKVQMALTAETPKAGQMSRISTANRTHRGLKKSPTWRTLTFRPASAGNATGRASIDGFGEQTAIVLALQAGHLLVVAELLLGMWRRGGKPHSYNDVELLDTQQVMDAVFHVWIHKETLRTETTATVRAFTLIVLSLKHRQQNRGGLNTFRAATFQPDTPRNPVLDALRMSVNCRNEAYRLERGGRRSLAARVNVLNLLFQLVALALLDGAQAATDEARALYSRWNVRKDSATRGIQPHLACSLWLQEATTYAAANKCRVFLADSLVYSHVWQVFLPGFIPAGKFFHQVWFVVKNILWIPVLIFMPHESIVERMKAQNFLKNSKDWVVWLYPYGGAIFRFFSGLAFALMLTLRRSPDDGNHPAVDWVLFVWTFSLALSVSEEIYHQGLTEWVAEVFHFLELVLLIPLAGIDVCIIRDMIDHSPSADFAQLDQSFQAFATLLAWFRLLQVCYYFPFAGPQLLTILYLVGDLAALLPMIVFILFAFTCAFSVLTFGDVAHDGGFFSFFITMFRQFVGITLNGEPQQLQTTFPGYDYETNTGAAVAVFLLMTLFGLLVVVMLLSLIVAKFSQSVDFVSRSIDSVYKVKLAQVTYASFLRLQTSALVPQPFNVARRLVLVAHGLARMAHMQTVVLFRKRRELKVGPQPSGDSIDRSRRASALGMWRGSRRRRLFSVLHAANLIAEESGLELAHEVSRFIEAAVSEVKLFPESVDAYTGRNEHLLIDGEAEIDLLSRVSDARRAQEANANALHTAQERQEEELKRQAHHSQLAAEHLSRFEDRLLQIESLLSNKECTPAVGSGHRGNAYRVSRRASRSCLRPDTVSESERASGCSQVSPRPSERFSYRSESNLEETSLRLRRESSSRITLLRP